MEHGFLTARSHAVNGPASVVSAASGSAAAIGRAIQHSVHVDQARDGQPSIRTALEAVYQLFLARGGDAKDGSAAAVTVASSLLTRAAMKRRTVERSVHVDQSTVGRPTVGLAAVEHVQHFVLT